MPARAEWRGIGRHRRERADFPGGIPGFRRASPGSMIPDFASAKTRAAGAARSSRAWSSPLECPLFRKCMHAAEIPSAPAWFPRRGPAPLITSATDGGRTMAKISVVKQVLDANDRIANENRKLFDRKGIFVINLMSSPGRGQDHPGGEDHLGAAGTEYRIGVIEGDIQDTYDADRIAGSGYPCGPDQYRRRLPHRRRTWSGKPWPTSISTRWTCSSTRTWETSCARPSSRSAKMPRS